MTENNFSSLVEYLSLIPGIIMPVETGSDKDDLWWVKFKVDIHHPLAWNVVQELGSVVNYLALDERLPSVFYPVSPPPYLNGGPGEFLSWVIETNDNALTPAIMMKWLEGRLPQPVTDVDQWNSEEE